MNRQIAMAMALALAMAAPASAEDSRRQLGQIGGAVKRVQQVRDIQMTDAEEQHARPVGQRTHPHALRRRPGCRRTSLRRRSSASVLAQASSKPGLPWTFVVLDTDAVNAFAAPGGYVHITRGALALIQNEAELAGVLGHELIHITEKHTIGAIQKSKSIQMGADETLSGNAALLNQLTERVYLDIIDNRLRPRGRKRERREGRGARQQGRLRAAGPGQRFSRGCRSGTRTRKRSAACLRRIRR